MKYDVKYYVWLGLRALGVAIVIVLCMDTANKLVFAAAGTAFWLILLTIVILGGILYWTYRVVWRRLDAVSTPPLWRRVQWFAGAVVILLVAYGGWQGWGDWVTFHSQVTNMQAQQQAMNSITGANGTVDNSLKALSGIESQIEPIRIAKMISATKINLVFVIVFLIVVTVIRVLVWRGQSLAKRARAVPAE